MIRRVREGEMLPAWYGCAWYDFLRNEMVCFPVGLNLLVMMGRAAYFAVKHGGHAVRINPRDAYAQGYRDGKGAPDASP